MHILTNLPSNFVVQNKRYFMHKRDLKSHIKKTLTYKEKCADKRLLYILALFILITFFMITDIVYVDESGINKEYQRGYGRAKRGVRVHGTKQGKRLKRTNIIAGLWYGVFGKRHVAMQCYEHSTNSAFFEDWFEWELLAVIPEYSIIIMDNASFHQKKRLYEIAARHNVFVLFLPPYSPDLNPIEKSWANFKKWLCDNLKHFPSIEWAAMCYFDD